MIQRKVKYIEVEEEEEEEEEGTIDETKNIKLNRHDSD